MKVRTLIADYNLNPDVGLDPPTNIKVSTLDTT